MKKTAMTLLSLVMMTSLAACSTNKSNDASPSASGTNGSEAPSPRPEITLDVFSLTSNFSGDQPGWFAKVVKDKFNIKLNIISPQLEGADAKFSAQMASGNLGDIVIFGGADQKWQDAIKAGMLLDWTKDSLLDNYGKNMLKYAPKAIEKNKVNYGSGTSVYGIGIDVGPDQAGPSEAKELNAHPNLRWDLYQKIGSPEIKTMEDYLPVLKKMQEAQPKSDSGRPTYAFSLWGDWDGNMMMHTKAWAILHGYEETDGFNPGGFTLISADKDEVQGILDDNGLYLRALKFYFNANQMGLMDPDSLTQKFEDASNKMKDGQVLFSMFSWQDDVYSTPERLAEGKGFQLVPFKEERNFSNGFNPYGADRFWSIGSKTKSPERVMEFIDWLYSPEGYMTSNYGLPGMVYELKDGKPVLTELGEKALPANDTPIPDEFGGGNWKDGRSQLTNTFKFTSVNPETGEPYDYQLWSSQLAKPSNKVDESWTKAMNATSPKDYLEKNNMLAVQKAIFTGTAPATYPDDLEQKRGQVATVIKEYSWKMIFAKNEAEFDKLKKELVDKAKGLGYEDVVKFNTEQSQKVFEYRKNK
ncbi:extracellular solute-binding protein [Gorillibacterium timonense]|uniref:extracellular solute-binding protein n=1 Tax=Gorillibacterium timonense TaxID=1689269 RepID=UPI00071E5D7D|nr:extracellular solute-binding protein [Gorillibacterium timonense]